MKKAKINDINIQIEFSCPYCETFISMSLFDSEIKKGFDKPFKYTCFECEKTFEVNPQNFLNEMWMP